MEGNNVKKRILAVICSVLLTLGMSMTAFATPSVGVGNVQASGKDGRSIKVIWGNNGSENCDIENCEGHIEIVSPVTDRFREIVDALPKTKVQDGKTWKLVYEFEAVGKNCLEGLYPVTLTFDTEDWASGTPLVYYYENGEWKLAKFTSDGTVFTVTINGSTPFVIYEEVKGSEGGEGGSQGQPSDPSKPSNPTSPSTGETPVSVWMACAVAGAAGVVLVSRRKEA